ncbi:MAG: His/Gly/Thr/Pro-type tRNA ligase C-terminal domain-containing protein, partial [Chloroflexota bacterium]
VQAMVLPIADRHVEYARNVQQRLIEAEIRAEVDDRSERLPLKIRAAQLQKVPYMLVVGNKEAEQGAVAVRLRSGQDLGAIPLDRFMEIIDRDVSTRALVPPIAGDSAA